MIPAIPGATMKVVVLPTLYVSWSVRRPGLRTAAAQADIGISVGAATVCCVLASGPAGTTKALRVGVAMVWPVVLDLAMMMIQARPRSDTRRHP